MANPQAPELPKKLLYAAAGVVGLLLLVVVFAGVADFESARDAGQPDWFVEALRSDREALMRGDAFRSLFFVGATVALLFFYLKNRVSYPLLNGLLVVLVLLDLGLVDRRHFNYDNFVRNPTRSVATATEADEYIMSQSQPHDRVLNLQVSPFQDGTTSYFHASVGGYHAAKIKRYQDLIDRQLSPEINALVADLQSGQKDFSGTQALNMLNTRFVLAGPTPNAVIENPRALGAAWLVQNVKQVNSPDEEIAALGNTNLANTAVVDVSKFTVDDSYNSSGTIRLVSAEPNEIVYEAEVPALSLAVFSEVYYPEGWTATIGDQEAPLLRANYILRALEVPAGKHTISFQFAPGSYEIGNAVTVFASGLLAVSVLLALGLTFRGLKQ